MYAFLSYQSADKEVAAKIKVILSQLGVESFLAHEDINVSEEWRLSILAELGKVRPLHSNPQHELLPLHMVQTGVGRCGIQRNYHCASLG